MPIDRKTLWKILLSAGVSLLILLSLFKLFHPEEDQINQASLISVLKNAVFPLIGLYSICTLAQAYFRAVRYKILLESSQAPSLRKIFWVTLTRNMFVDFLPSRAGELAYIAMMNKGYQVKGADCVSSLTVSLLFDFISLLIIMTGIMSVQILSGEAQGWLYGVVVVLSLAVVLMTVFVYAGLKQFTAVLKSLLRQRQQQRIVQKLLNFLDSLVISFERTKSSKTFAKALILSLAVRFFKYAGLYLLFVAITQPSFEHLSGASPVSVFLAFISAEGSASLPIPTFMSFGTYEAGGGLALKVLGFSVSESVLAMLAIHIYSQTLDYTLGIIAFLIFMFHGQILKDCFPDRKK